jgi:hypothetical protein
MPARGRFTADKLRAACPGRGPHHRGRQNSAGRVDGLAATSLGDHLAAAEGMAPRALSTLGDTGDVSPLHAAFKSAALHGKRQPSARPR